MARLDLALELQTGFTLVVYAYCRALADVSDNLLPSEHLDPSLELGFLHDFKALRFFIFLADRRRVFLWPLFLRDHHYFP